MPYAQSQADELTPVINPLRSSRARGALAFAGMLVVLVVLPDLALAEPAAPEGLENKHDYATVDISTLDGWELTYVPEARKKPIFDAILKGVNWRLRDDVKQAPFCEDVHRRLMAWDDVEIIEPTIRANRYGDPLFRPWHEQCPDMDPHKATAQRYHRGYLYDIGIVFGSSHFKVFEIPHSTLNINRVLLYFRGNVRDKFMDRYGKYIQSEPYIVSGSGHYRVVDLETCKVTSTLRNIPSIPFPYYQPFAKKTYSESVVLRIGGEYFAVGGNRSPVSYLPGFISYYRLSNLSAFVAEPDCVLEAK